MIAVESINFKEDVVKPFQLMCILNMNFLCPEDLYNGPAPP